MVQVEEWKRLEQSIGDRESLDGPAQEWFVRRYGDIGHGFCLSTITPSSSRSSSFERICSNGTRSLTRLVVFEIGSRR